MQISSSPSVSALKAYSQALDVTANNVANVNTDGFKRSASVFTEKSGGGVTHQSVQEKAQQDYAKDATNLMVYTATAKMNSSAFKTQTETSQRAIDMIA